MGFVYHEHRPADFGIDKLAGVDNGNGADSAGSGRKRHVSERVCQRKRRTGTVGFAVCYERSDASVYVARIFFGQRLEHDAQHYQRYGAAGLFCERDVSVETVRRPRIPVRVLYPPVDGAAFRSSGVAVCTLAHLCGRA